MAGTKLETYTNDLEIRVFGMRRSGNHGVINWIGSQAPSPPHFFNCVSNRGHSPFRTGKSPKMPEIWYPHGKYKHVSDEELKKVADMKKDILIYNYEDLDIAKLCEHEFPLDRENTVGRSRKRVDILILRDFVNWMASKLIVPPGLSENAKMKNKFQNLTMERFNKNRDNFKYFNYYDGWENDAEMIRGLNYANTRKSIPRWKRYADEFLGRTSILWNPIFINYNLWHVDKNYRRVITEGLGFEFTDEGKGKVSLAGNGSSFQMDETDASNLDVFNRWKYFRSNKIFKDLIRYHVDVLDDSNRIFNEDKEITAWLEED